MLITKEIEIDMAHRVPNHKSKCQNLHGHRYKIEVGVDDKIIDTKGSSDEGMVIDFGDLKQIMMEEIDQKFDHNGIFYKDDTNRVSLELISTEQPKDILFVDFIPTAENLAKYWYELLEPRLKERGIKIKHLKVWETPTSTAIYQITE
jgi:6-pyruvoyltetrahydropterin/6-carboxytetrahydropterin synthase